MLGGATPARAARIISVVNGQMSSDYGVERTTIAKCEPFKPRLGIAAEETLKGLSKVLIRPF